MQHFKPALPPPALVAPRHALLFELLRQRGLAQSVNQRLARSRPARPPDLSHLAMIAARSLGGPDQAAAHL